jgi:hypothetical protein
VLELFSRPFPDTSGAYEGNAGQSNFQMVDGGMHGCIERYPILVHTKFPALLSPFSSGLGGTETGLELAVELSVDFSLSFLHGRIGVAGGILFDQWC